MTLPCWASNNLSAPQEKALAQMPSCIGDFYSLRHPVAQTYSATFPDLHAIGGVDEVLLVVASHQLAQLKSRLHEARWPGCP